LSAFVEAPLDAMSQLPLHPARQRQRVSSQAELLADWLRDHLLLPLAPALQASDYPAQTAFACTEADAKFAGRIPFTEKKGDVRKLRVAFN